MINLICSIRIDSSAYESLRFATPQNVQYQWDRNAQDLAIENGQDILSDEEAARARAAILRIVERNRWALHSWTGFVPQFYEFLIHWRDQRLERELTDVYRQSSLGGFTPKEGLMFTLSFLRTGSTYIATGK